MRFQFKKAACIVAVVALTGFGVARSQGAITDTMDNTNNFYNAYGGEQITANGDGTVSVIRTQPNSAVGDAGVDWRPGNVNIPISGNENLTVSPSSQINGGYWVPTILLFDSSGAYIAEKPWGTDRNTTASETLNIPAFALQNSITNAAEYFLRLRMDPSESTNVGFSFTEIDTTAAIPTPEPASLGLLGFGALALVRRRRA